LAVDRPGVDPGREDRVIIAAGGRHRPGPTFGSAARRAADELQLGRVDAGRGDGGGGGAGLLDTGDVGVKARGERRVGVAT
jgi:hypothetical protein